jgi:HEAT repeat protein
MDVADLLRQLAGLMASQPSTLDGPDEFEAVRDRVAAFGEAVQPDLEALLADSDPAVAYQAALVLERMPDEGALRAAVGHYLDHANDLDARGEPIWYARLLAVGGRALPVVEERLAPGAPLDGRLAAVFVLASLAGTAATARLEELAQDPDHRVAQTAAEALGRVGGPLALSVLLALLDHPHANVRYGALDGLALAADGAVVERLVDKVEADHAVVQAWWPSPAAGELTVSSRAAALVTQLTGESFEDVATMRAWVAEHRPDH